MSFFPTLVPFEVRRKTLMGSTTYGYLGVTLKMLQKSPIISSSCSVKT